MIVENQEISRKSLQCLELKASAYRDTQKGNSKCSTRKLQNVSFKTSHKKPTLLSFSIPQYIPEVVYLYVHKDKLMIMCCVVDIIKSYRIFLAKFMNSLTKSKVRKKPLWIDINQNF